MTTGSFCKPSIDTKALYELEIPMELPADQKVNEANSKPVIHNRTFQKLARNSGVFCKLAIQNETSHKLAIQNETSHKLAIQNGTSHKLAIQN